MYSALNLSSKLVILDFSYDSEGNRQKCGIRDIDYIFRFSIPNINRQHIMSTTELCGATRCVTSLVVEEARDSFLSKNFVETILTAKESIFFFKNCYQIRSGGQDYSYSFAIPTHVRWFSKK